MFGAMPFGAPYFGQGPGEPIITYGPVAEYLEAANGPPTPGAGSGQQVVAGAAGQNAVLGSGAFVTFVVGEGARE